MTLIFLAGKALQARRIVKNPLFQAAPQSTKLASAQLFARDVGIGVAVRAPFNFALGIVLDPFNLIAVPLSGDRLITTNQAVAQVLAGPTNIKDPGKVLAAIVLATPSFLLDLGIQISQKAFRGVREGKEMIVGAAEAFGVSTGLGVSLSEIFG